MATRRNYHEDYQRHNSSAPAWGMFMVMFVGVVIFGAYLAPDILHAPGLPEQTKRGAVGNQAPPNTRGTLRGSDTFIPTAPEAAINDYNATAQAQYDAAVKAGGNPTLVLEVATPLPLPLNSAGEPVISHAQQAQMQQSLNVALDEGMTAADQQLAAERQAMYTAVAVQAPDVSKEDAEQMMHRDLCHVPRADPHTCSQGLYKPTPVN